GHGPYVAVRGGMMKPLLLTLAVPLLACAHDPVIDDGWSDTGKADDANSGGVTPTEVDNARLLDGFAKLLDSTTDACVTAAVTDPAYTVGAIEKPFDLFYVST